MSKQETERDDLKSKLRVVIVEDEELARHVLREMLQTHPEIEIVGEYTNGFEAVKMVPQLKPDLIFLDVEMPKLDGFEVLEMLDKDISVIFVTAYDEHALRAFDVNAVDYLLKPYNVERFNIALDRAKQRIGRRMHAPAEEAASSGRSETRYAERIVIKDGPRVEIIPVAKLDFAEAQDDYVALASEGKKRLRQQTISSLEASLDPKDFLRIHRSYIVNLNQVIKVEHYTKETYVATLKDGTRLPVSRAGYARLRARFEQNS